MYTTFNRGDVFYADLGYDGTHCQSGTRPIVIVSNQRCNVHSPIISVVCLTTSRTKSKLPTHVTLPAFETGLPKDSICMCEQPMSLPKTKIRDFVTSLSNEYMSKIDNGLRCQLCL